MDNTKISLFLLASEMQRQLLCVSFAIVGVAHVVVAHHYERNVLRNRTSNQPTSSSRKRKRQSNALAGSLDKLSSTLIDVFKKSNDATLKMVELMTNQRANEVASIQDELAKINDDLNNMGYSTYDRVRLLKVFVEKPTNVTLFKVLKTVEERQTLLSMM